MERLIGKGKYGFIFATTYNGKEAAVKKVSISNYGIDSIMELSIMAIYNHPMLNKALAIECVNDQILIYQDLALYDLKQYISSVKDRGERIPESLSRTWIQDLCFALEFLHKEGIVHGDVKPQNILIHKDDRIVLSDFGCSTVLGENKTTRLIGTTRYSSPEMLIDSILSPAGDIWSFGCVIYEILSGRALVTSFNKSEISCQTRAAKAIQNWREQRGDAIHNPIAPIRSTPIEFTLTGDNAKFIDPILSYNSEDRPNASTIYLHPWFCGVIKRDTVDISCRMLSERDLEISKDAVKSYFKSRELDTSNEIMYVISTIYSLSSMSGTVDIEASIQIVSKMYDISIQNYHPRIRSKDITRSELAICIANGFKLHKIARHTNSMLLPVGLI